MFIKKLTGSWLQGVERAIKTQQRTNKKLLKLFLTHSATQALRHTPVPKLRTKPVKLPAAPKAPGAVTMPAPGKWLKFTHAASVREGASAQRMSYWLYLPEQMPASRLPLVVMLHGCAQTATQFAQSTRMNLLAEKKGFAVLYPQQPAVRNGGRCWRWYKKSIQEGGGEVGAIVAIIERVAERYALDKRRIYIAGISAGAAMANIVALNHPHLIAAVGMHSGSVFGAAQTPMEGYSVMQNGAVRSLRSAVRKAAAPVDRFPVMPAILIHGQEDSVVRPVNLAHVAEQFRELHHLAGLPRDAMQLKVTEKPGGPRAGYAYKTYDYIAGGKTMLKVCEVAGLEHAWCGGDRAVRFSDGKGPDASKLMWDFFSRHRRRNAEHTSTADAADGSTRADRRASA